MRRDNTKAVRQIKDKDGKILTETAEITKRWGEYFKNMLEATNYEENKTEIAMDPQVTDGTDGIRLEEVEEEVQKLKNGKAPGQDNIKAEMLKYMGKEGIKLLHEIIATTWSTKQIPDDWKTAVILPLYKKGDKRECGNYRGISLLCAACKVYEKVLEKRLRRVTEHQLNDSQSGFRPGYSVQDHIFTLRNLTDKYLKYDKELHLCFIDLVKAFDKVPRQEIWNTLEKYNVDHNLIEAIKSMYRISVNTVRVLNEETEKIVTTQGVRQGGVLSPLLFVLFLNEVIKECSEKSKKINVGYHRMRTVCISECVFADDIVVIANNEEALQHNIELWIKSLSGNGRNINTKKTKTMVEIEIDLFEFCTEGCQTKYCIILYFIIYCTLVIARFGLHSPGKFLHAERC